MEQKTEIKIEDLHKEQAAVLGSDNHLPAYKEGRSIVTSCYRKELPSTYILLCELCRLGFDLPIEIFYREGELNHEEIQELTKIYPQYIKFKKLNNIVPNFKDRWGNFKGWGVKVYAILESEFEENLWIDSDNIPIRNCSDLFEDSEYKSKGSLFWRDVYSVDRSDMYSSSSIMWKIFDIPCNDGEPFESGQFLINKNICWKQLSLMKYYTDRMQVYYNFGGDAECWRLAWQYVSTKTNNYHSSFNYQANPNVPYGFMPYGPFHKGVPNPWKKYGGGSVMVQRDRDGLELFNHRNIYKFSFFDENPFNKDVTNEDRYHLILNHIKVKYNIKNVPPTNNN